jgi:hypothetical protein
MVTPSYLWMSDIPVIVEEYITIPKTAKEDLQALFYTYSFIPGSSIDYVKQKKKFLETYSRLSAADLNRSIQLITKIILIYM